MRHLAYFGGIVASLVVGYLGSVLMLHTLGLGYTSNAWVAAGRMFGAILGGLVFMGGLAGAWAIAKAWAEYGSQETPAA